jgi:osmoprotectant transport system permease protein
VSKSLGFDDSYVLGMQESEAARLNVKTISDLTRYPGQPGNR